MDDETLKHLLTAKAHREIPDSLDLRERIHGKIRMTAPTTTPLRLPVRFSRLALVAALLALATVSYAVFQALIQPDPGMKAVQNDHLVAQIQQVQPVLPLPQEFADLKVGVDYAYADSNRITAAFHVSGQAGGSSSIQFYVNPTLTDHSGTTFSWIPSSGQQAMEVPDGTADSAGQTTFRLDGIMSFDASGLETAPSSLNLNLTLDIAYSTAELQANDPYAMVMAGQTRFQFALPFNPGQTVAVNQSATAGGRTLELKQVVIAPSLTRLEFCTEPGLFASTDEHWLDWQVSVQVQVNGASVLTTDHASFAGLHGQPLDRQAACRSLVIPEKLVEHPGTWQLTVTRFQNTGTGESINGPWVLPFNVNP